MSNTLAARGTILLAALVFAGMLGCGSSTATVTGKVRYKEKPVSTGQINFIGEDGKSRSSTISSDGTYEILEAPIGPVTVTVVATNLVARAPKGAATPSAIGAGTKGGGPTGQVYNVTLIPTKYNEPHTSGLKYTVSSGRQTIDIDLKN